MAPNSGSGGRSARPIGRTQANLRRIPAEAASGQGPHRSSPIPRGIEVESLPSRCCTAERPPLARCTSQMLLIARGRDVVLAEGAAMDIEAGPTEYLWRDDHRLLRQVRSLGARNAQREHRHHRHSTQNRLLAQPQLKPLSFPPDGSQQGHPP